MASSVGFDPARKLTGKDLFSTEEAIKRFGEPGKGNSAEARQVMFDLPYPMRLYDRGAPVVKHRMQCHELVAEWAEAALRLVLNAYGQKRIVELGLDVFSGSYVPRFVRGSKHGTWSKHAFGIAFDFLAKENGLRTPFAKATFSRPEYKDWLDCWRCSGFANLGQVEGFGRDAMHFEFMKSL
jgi:hypothetical protein